MAAPERPSRRRRRKANTTGEFLTRKGITYGPGYTPIRNRPARQTRAGLSRIADEVDLYGQEAKAFTDAVSDYRAQALDHWLQRVGLEPALTAMEPLERHQFREAWAVAAGWTPIRNWPDLQAGVDTESTSPALVIACAMPVAWRPPVRWYLGEDDPDETPSRLGSSA